MLKRRALWERESSSRLSWPWKLSHRWLGAHSSDVQYLSSSQTPKSKMEEPREGHSKPDSPLTTFHKDFESFKKAVDRAIERDPYGTLFGRRLQSPPTANNSSWTSFSWIFDPKEIKEESPDSQKSTSPASSNAPSKTSARPEAMPRTETQSVQSSRIPTSQSAAVDDYEYDPISMRKSTKDKRKGRRVSYEGD